MRALQKELDEVRETRQREKERESRRAREDEEELQILRDRLENLEEERANGRGSGGVRFPIYRSFSNVDFCIGRCRTSRTTAFRHAESFR